MYKLCPKPVPGYMECVQRLFDMAFIPYDPMNSDYQKFKSDVLAGDTLQDVDGVAMSQADADAYIKTLP